MITNEKIKEIGKKIRAGIPEGEIKEELIRNGYSDKDIAKVFAPHKYDMRSWYMYFGAVLFFVSIWFI